MCGVPSTFSSERNGWSAGSGSVSKTSSAASAMRREVSADSSAASSTSGPREVFTSRLLGFISASSLAPSRPRVFGLSTMCSVSTSDRRSSSSLLTAVAPRSAARSGVMLGLHVITFMPNSPPTSATAPPTRPRPSTPSVLPARPMPMPCCQAPRRNARFSCTM